MSDNIFPIFEKLVSRKEKEEFLNQHARLLWFTGLSGSGKSTIAQHLERALFKEGFLVQVLDGDNIRTGISNNLGFSIVDREENIRRIAEVAKLYVNTGIITLCSFVSPSQKIRKIAEEIVGKEDHIGVYVKASLATCEKRDVKGLYKKARAGEIKDFTGIDAPFEAPSNPNLILDTDSKTVEESVKEVLDYLMPIITKK